LFTPTDSIDGPTRELDAYVPDLRVALESCAETDCQAGLRLLAATRDVWWRQNATDGRRWARVFLKECLEPSLARAQALQAAAMLASIGDPAEARELLKEARELAATRDKRTTAMIDLYLGVAAYAEEEGAASVIAHFHRSVATLVELNDARGTALLHIMIGWALLIDRSRRAEAHIQLEQNRQRAEELGDGYAVGLADYGLGLYWRWGGQPQRALDHFRLSLVRLHSLQVAPGETSALLHIARLLASTDPQRASRLASAGLALAEHAGVHLPSRLVRSVEQLHADLATRLGHLQTQRAWADGARLSMSEAVTLALAEMHESDRPGGLSAREFEIAQLVTSGLSSRQIAEKLNLSVRTVDSHLRRIFDKVGVANRLQLGTWLLRHGGQPVTPPTWQTAQALRGGWMHSGDMAYLDEDNYVYIVDRKKDMIITGGENVYSTEVEAVLYQHPAVLEVAVIGIPDPQWGETVNAVLVLKPGENVSSEELQQFCRERIAGYKLPRSVEFRESLPKTATGKINKRILRTPYWAGQVGHGSLTDALLDADTRVARSF
jgi:DNA-binding CsgD family transcriptional regulator